MTVSPTQRAALVFIPGMNRSWGEHSLRDVADDIVNSLQRNSEGVEFAVTPAETFAYGSSESPRSARVVTIGRVSVAQADQPTTPVLDMYEYAYIRDLSAGLENRPILVRALFVLWALIRGLLQLVPMLTSRRKGKTTSERLEILYGSVVLLLYTLLLVILFIAIVQFTFEAFASAAASLGGQAGPASEPTQAAAVSAQQASTGVATFFQSTIARLSRFVALVGAVIWMLLPPKAQIKQAITDAATDLLAVDYYLRAGVGGPRLAGDLLGLLDAVREPHRGYRRVDLVSYSFGSVVALNTLFPYRQPPQAGSPVERLSTLVTIGCPFDFIRLILPSYFENRFGRTDMLKGGWLNVYTPNDILGSNFRNDNSVDDPDDYVLPKVSSSDAPPADPSAAPAFVGKLKPRNAAYYPGGVPQGKSFLDILVFSGFQAHSQYWDPSQSGEASCFDQIASFLYAGDSIVPVLKPSPAPDLNT